jgi:hypothetical protein
MPQRGFEPKMSVLERAKTVYALDRTTTVIGHEGYSLYFHETDFVRKGGSLKNMFKRISIIFDKLH